MRRLVVEAAGGSSGDPRAALPKQDTGSTSLAFDSSLSPIPRSQVRKAVEPHAWVNHVVSAGVMVKQVRVAREHVRWWHGGGSGFPPDGCVTFHFHPPPSSHRVCTGIPCRRTHFSTMALAMAT
jgi:hypothetical protein